MSSIENRSEQKNNGEGELSGAWVALLSFIFIFLIGAIGITFLGDTFNLCLTYILGFSDAEHKYCY